MAYHHSDFHNAGYGGSESDHSSMNPNQTDDSSLNNLSSGAQTDSSRSDHTSSPLSLPDTPGVSSTSSLETQSEMTSNTFNPLDSESNSGSSDLMDVDEPPSQTEFSSENFNYQHQVSDPANPLEDRQDSELNISPQAASSAQDPDETETPDDDLIRVLFVGNPGVGKSTLLNCLVNQRNQDKSKQRVMFQSGISFNTGMTKELNTAKYDGHMYMDTPGLEDTKIRKEAAEAITKALSMGGRYQVIFVVTLEAGRVRPGDITTMSLVLESARDISHYGVIFNKMGKRLFRELTDQNKAELTSQISLCSMEHKPIPLPLFVQKSTDLEDESNAITEMNDLEEFVSSIIPVHVKEENVARIPIESYEELKEKIETDLEFLKSNNEEMQKRIQEDAQTFKIKLANTIKKAEVDYEFRTRKLQETQDEEVRQMKRELEEIEMLRKKQEEKRKEEARRQEEARKRTAMSSNPLPPASNPYTYHQGQANPMRNQYNPYQRQNTDPSHYQYQVHKQQQSQQHQQYQQPFYPMNQGAGMGAYQQSVVPSYDQMLDIKEKTIKKRLKQIDNEKAKLIMEKKTIKAMKNRDSLNMFQKFWAKLIN